MRCKERKVRNRQVKKNKVLFLTYGGEVFAGEKILTSGIMKKANNK